MVRALVRIFLPGPGLEPGYFGKEVPSVDDPIIIIIWPDGVR